MGLIIDKLKGLIITKPCTTRVAETATVSVTTTVKTILDLFPNGIPADTEYIDLQLSGNGPIVLSTRELPTAGNSEGNKPMREDGVERLSGLGDMRSFRYIRATAAAGNATLDAQRYVRVSK